MVTLDVLHVPAVHMEPGALILEFPHLSNKRGWARISEYTQRLAKPERNAVFSETLLRT